MASIVHILKSQPGEEKLLERANAYIESLETDSGEPLFYGGSERTPGGMTIHSWHEQKEGGAVVEIVDDPASGTRSLSVEAPARETCERLAQTLCDLLPCRALEELLVDAADAEKIPHAMMRLALGWNSGFDDRVAKLLVSGLASEDREVRIDAATGMSSLQWPQFGPALREARRKESEQGAQAVLDHAIARCGVA